MNDKEIQKAFDLMRDKCSKDPIYFIEKALYTYNPKQEPYHLKFELFNFQKRLVRQLLDHIINGEDFLIDKCREMGATYTTLAVIIWCFLYKPAFNCLIGSRKEDYVDNRRGGVTGNKEESLFGKIDYMLSRMPSFLLPKGFIKDKHFNYMSLVNPENGNVISGESSNANFSRGSRRTMILLDEFAFWDNDYQVWGATADTAECRIILTTPGDKPSKAKRLRFNKDGEKIDVLTLHHNLDPRKDKKWIDKERERRSVEDFNREIMVNWEGSITGRVYPEIDNASYGEFPYLLDQPVFFSWDFGLDGISIGVFQRNKKTSKWRIVDSYHNEDKPIQFYLPFFHNPIDSKFDYNDDDIKAIEEFKKYPKGIHFGDPDVKKRSLLTGTSTRQELEKAGVYVQCLNKNDFYMRREKTKVLLQNGIEINSNRRNEYLYEAIKSARYPQRAIDSQATTPIALPIHNWTSHPRTMLEYFCVNIDNVSDTKEKPRWAGKVKKWLTNRKKY